MLENTYNPYPVFTAVFDPRHGWGTVTKVIDTDVLPVKVTFQNGFVDAYDFDGKQWAGDRCKMLYKSEVQIVEG